MAVRLTGLLVPSGYRAGVAEKDQPEHESLGLWAAELVVLSAGAT